MILSLKVTFYIGKHREVAWEILFRHSSVTFFSLKILLFIYFIKKFFSSLEDVFSLFSHRGKEGGERERERNINVREKRRQPGTWQLQSSPRGRLARSPNTQDAFSSPPTGTEQQPDYVPRPGIKSMTMLQSTEPHQPELF